MKYRHWPQHENNPLETDNNPESYTSYTTQTQI